MNGFIIRVLPTDNTLYGNANNPIEIGMKIITSSPEGESQPTVKFGIKPEEDIPISTIERIGQERITGILEGGVEYKDIMPKIHEALERMVSGGFWSIGFNHISYDFKILNDNFRKMGLSEINPSPEKTIDLMRYAEIALDYKKVGSFTLPATYASMMGKSVERERVMASDTAYEVDVIFEMLMKCASDLNSTTDIFSTIHDFISKERDVEELTFGKYKGLKISEAIRKDHGYVSWIIRNQDFKAKNPNLVRSCKKALNEMPE
jgi:hypothetical protein